MKILYFTASGNSLAAAKRFDAERLSIPQMIREKRYEVVDDEAVGIVYPVYNAGLPYIVRIYLEQCKIEAPYVFVIATYGNMAGGTVHEMEKVLAAGGNHADYYETLLMVDNYLDVQRKLIANGNYDLKRPLQWIMYGDEFILEPSK